MLLQKSALPRPLSHWCQGPALSALSSSVRPDPLRSPEMWPVRAVFVLFCLQLADFTDPSPCIIELECEECLPDNMPLVTSHPAVNGSVRVPAGAELTLSCGGGRFLLYPLVGALPAVCEAGRYRVRADSALRHLLDLGCQEEVFEDVLHPVEHCPPPLQGRAYQTQRAGRAGVRHLATVCFDAERALARSLHAGSRLALPPHEERAAPLSLFGNFNHMFDARSRHDAERLFSDDARLNRRLRELFKHEGYCFAEQALTAGRLLSGLYFDDQSGRVAEFPSNRVASWRSIVGGNLHHLHGDVAALLRHRRGRGELDVYAGTHGVLSLQAGEPRPEVYLMAGRRFPVPRYIWTAVHSRERNEGLALVLLNDPFVTVSEIRAAVFCESSCGAARWLPRLTAQRRYERPLAGLVFCCALADLARHVPEMPAVFNATVQPLY